MFAENIGLLFISHINIPVSLAKEKIKGGYSLLVHMRLK